VLIAGEEVPQYPSNCVQTVSHSNSRPGLRSSDTAMYAKPRCRTKFSFREHGFSRAGSTAWNSLPHHLHHICDTGVFSAASRPNYSI